MDDHDGADAIERAWRDGLTPDPLLTVWQWADRYRVLSQRASSEPGRWRTERTPYLREIMDSLSPGSPASVWCSWKRRTSSAVAVAGERPMKAKNVLTCRT
jgi:phage terminase large subunit GpA-like protein